MRLGRLPHSPDAVAAAPRYLMGAEAPPPAQLLRGDGFVPGLYQNDTLPDCTAVGLANCATAFGLVHTGAPPVIEAATVPAFYSACVGNPPDLEATNGAVMQDVLCKAALGSVDFGEQVSLVPTYFACDPTNRDELAHVASVNGCGYWGLRLTAQDMRSIGAAVLDDDGSDNSGIVGGHCVAGGWAYTGLGDGDTVLIATWGRLQAVTWRWVASRLEEAWAVSWPQLVGPGA